MGRLDLSDLNEWTDDDVVQALLDIDHGLTDGQIEWVERFDRRLRRGDPPTERMREVAEDILRRAN